jgi:hypothetical protein
MGTRSKNKKSTAPEAAPDQDYINYQLDIAEKKNNVLHKSISALSVRLNLIKHLLNKI